MMIMDDELLEKPTVKISIGGVTRNAFQLFRRYWIAGLIFGAVVALVNGVLFAIPFVSTLVLIKILWFLVVDPLLLNGFILFIDRAEHKKSHSLDEIAQAITKMSGKILVVYWITLLFAALGFLLLIIPGIVVLIMFGAASYFVILRESGIKEALSKSRELTRGNKWRIFLVFLLLYCAFLFILVVLLILLDLVA